MDTTGISIVAQVAAKAATELYTALLATGRIQVWDAEEFSAIHTKIFDEIIDLTTRGASAGVQTAFPGSQIVQVPQTPTVPPVAAPLVPVQPQQVYAPPVTTPPPPAPPAAPPPAAQPAGACPQCNGQMYDNLGDNQRRRQAGYSLGADYKCKDRNCAKALWPADFEAFKHLPREPRQ